MTDKSSNRFRDLYRRYGPVIYSRCRKAARDDASAQKATACVFLELLEHLEAPVSREELLERMYRLSESHCAP